MMAYISTYNSASTDTLPRSSNMYSARKREVHGDLGLTQVALKR